MSSSVIDKCWKICDKCTFCKDNRPCNDDEDEDKKDSEDDEDVNEDDDDDKDDDDKDCRPCEAEQALIFEPLVQLALSFAYLTIFLVRIL